MSNSLKVFLSHKTVTHGNAAQELSEILYKALDEECKNKLEIYCSPDLKPGEIWRQTIYNQLKNADLFIVLYLAEGENVKMAWCDFEAGFYEGFSSSIEGKKRRLVPVVAEGKTPPCPLSEREVIYVNYQGIKKLLKIIFDFDDNKKKLIQTFLSKKTKRNYTY